MDIKNLVFVTGREHKLREARAILGFDIEGLDLHVPEIQSIDFETVVKEKAKSAAMLAGRAVVVDDSGICVDAFNGFPGALTRHFMDTLGNKGILKLLKDEKTRRAVAKAAVGMCEPGGEPLVFLGETTGAIAFEERGQNGFGFDPVFIPDGKNQTYAEMDFEEKNEVSHRRKALELLKGYFSGH